MLTPEERALLEKIGFHYIDQNERGSYECAYGKSHEISPGLYGHMRVIIARVARRYKVWCKFRFVVRRKPLEPMEPYMEFLGKRFEKKFSSVTAALDACGLIAPEDRETVPASEGCR